jgi:hypothetical protein
MSIVLKLQKKCLDKNEDLQSLLREALLISTKLKLFDFKDWVNNELKGYEDYFQVPKYREIYSTLRFFSQFHGWTDATFNDEKIADIINKNNLMQPIGELEHISLKENELTLSILPSHEQMIKKLFNTDSKPAKFIGKTQIYGIVEQVRNILLEWTLKLEEDGILGSDDVIFSEKEKEVAQKNIHIENFTGIMGNIDKLGNMSSGENATNIYITRIISTIKLIV